MGYQVLARKWRPRKFQEIIGQPHVVRSLQNAIKNEKIGHAYMFVGTRGVGKTSVARIFAKTLRCENLTADINACGECPGCLDFHSETSMNVVEIDGASNNSVDNIRELISNIQYLPTRGKHKVYIIDEVHMLSTSAFNALLKTLEEPPAHVVFIFATTEVQKLLGTVLSRCLRLDFRNATVETLIAHLEEMSKVENIKFQNKELMKELAVMANGSIRDMQSLLDQVLTYAEGNYIDEQVLASTLGIAGPQSIKKLVDAIYFGKPVELQQIYDQLVNENVPVKNIARALLDEFYGQLRSKIKKNISISSAEQIWIYESLARETSWIFNSLVPERAFEILLLKVTLRREFFNREVAESSTVLEEASTGQIAEESKEVVLEEQQTKDKSIKNEIHEQKEMQEVENEIKDFSWGAFITYLQSKSPATASNLEQGNLLSPICFDGNNLRVEVGFSLSAQVFMEYLSEPDVHQKIVLHLSSYFDISINSVSLELKEALPNEEFFSHAEVKEQEIRASMQEKVEEFKKHPLLVEAEKLFNAKIDKIILT